MVLMIARNDEHQREHLARDAPADGRPSWSLRGAALPRRGGHSCVAWSSVRQTSITIGRIIGRRLVRSKKKRDRVSRIFVFR